MKRKGLPDKKEASPGEDTAEDDVLSAQSKLMFRSMLGTDQKTLNAKKTSMFTDFLVDLFTGTAQNRNLNPTSNQNLTEFLPIPLDQSLLLSTAKKRDLSNLLKSGSGTGNELSELRGARDFSAL